MGAHARNLQLQGQNPEDVDWIGKGEAEKSNLPEKEKLLMQYVKVLTLEPAQVTDRDIERLRKVGWTDDQIAEASFNTALFAFFTHVVASCKLPEDQVYTMTKIIRDNTQTLSTVAKELGANLVLTIVNLDPRPNVAGRREGRP